MPRIKPLYQSSPTSLELAMAEEFKASELGVDADFLDDWMGARYILSALKVLSKQGWKIRGLKVRIVRPELSNAFAYYKDGEAVFCFRASVRRRMLLKRFVRACVSHGESGFWSTQSKYAPVFHEVGHYLHYKKLKRRSSYRPFAWIGRMGTHEKMIASTVSRVAMLSYSDFVSECFSLIVSGGRLNAEAWNLYKRLKGPRPRERKRHRINTKGSV